MFFSGIIPSPSGGGLGWGWSLPVLTLLATLALMAALTGGTASANGAVRLVVIDEVAGPYLLRVGVLPGDPTLGPLHVSILIQDATGETAVDDATVSVAAAGPGAPSQTEAVNSPQEPQLYEGNLYLDALGDWSLTWTSTARWGRAVIPSPSKRGKKAASTSCSSSPPPLRCWWSARWCGRNCNGGGGSRGR